MRGQTYSGEKLRSELNIKTIFFQKYCILFYIMKKNP